MAYAKQRDDAFDELDVVHILRWHDSIHVSIQLSNKFNELIICLKRTHESISQLTIMLVPLLKAFQLHEPILLSSHKIQQHRTNTRLQVAY